MKKIRWLDMDLVIEVQEEEKAGKQTKFYGKCVEAKDPFWLGEMVETPFLYKSGSEVI